MTLTPTLIIASADATALPSPVSTATHPNERHVFPRHSPLVLTSPSVTENVLANAASNLVSCVLTLPVLPSPSPYPQTGLCVYEIDDPALRYDPYSTPVRCSILNQGSRDDPSLDEATRLRNRIAELESLVRELRGMHLALVISSSPDRGLGKPHPRWADANFRDGDPSERWHSRAAKNSLHLRRRVRSPDTLARSNQEPRGLVSASGTPIKIEPIAEIAQPHLYRFTPSPPASYPAFHSDNSASPPYERQNGHHYSNGNLASNARSSMPYPSPTSTNGLSYSHQPPDPPYHENGNVYQMNACEAGNHYPSDSPPTQHFCACRTNPGAEHALVSLGQQLQSTLASLRQYTQHPESSQCQLFRRINELSNLMQYVPVLSPRGDLMSRMS